MTLDLKTKEDWIEEDDKNTASIECSMCGTVLVKVIGKYRILEDVYCNECLNKALKHE